MNDETKKWLDVLGEYVPMWMMIILFPLLIIVSWILFKFEAMIQIFSRGIVYGFVYATIGYMFFITGFAVKKYFDKLKPGGVFKGQWEKYYLGPQKEGEEYKWRGPEVFEIVKGYQYITYQENMQHHRFDVINLKKRKRSGKIEFTLIYKFEKHKDQFPRKNTLKIIDTKRMDFFEGNETGDNTGEYTKVRYKKIYPKE